MRRSFVVPFAPLAVLASAVLPLGAFAASQEPPSSAPSETRLGESFEWRVPERYRVEMVVTQSGKSAVIRQVVDGSNRRVEIEMEKEGSLVMIERGGDEPEMILLMPHDGTALRYGSKSMAKVMAESKDSQAEGTVGAVEFLGTERVSGRALNKLRVTTEDGEATLWSELETNAPVRMVMEDASIEWRNLEIGAADPKAFQVPKGTEIHDYDRVLAEAEAMSGMGGVGFGLGGMAAGMMGGAGGAFGEGLGAGLGGALGGPMGAMAGRYVGGRMGRMLGSKAADTAGLQ